MTNDQETGHIGKIAAIAGVLGVTGLVAYWYSNRDTSYASKKAAGGPGDKWTYTVTYQDGTVQTMPTPVSDENTSGFDAYSRTAINQQTRSLAASAYRTRVSDGTRVSVFSSSGAASSGSSS